MKKIPIIYIAFFPYVLILTIYFAVAKEANNNWLVVFIMSTFTLMLLFVIAFIWVIIHILFRGKAKEILFANLLVKIAYIPIHVGLFFIMLGMGNPFLFLFMFIPVVISIMIMGVTGTIAIVGIIKGYREDFCKLPTAIIFGILSYCYLGDIIIAIVCAVKSAKKEKSKRSLKQLHETTTEIHS